MTNIPFAMPFIGPAGDFSGKMWSRPDLATFSTWLNQVNATSSPTTATATDNPNGLPLVLAAAGESTGANFVPTMLLKPIGAPPWTITVAFAAFAMGTPGGGATLYSWPIPLGLYDTSGDKLEVIEWVSGITGSGTFYDNIVIGTYHPTSRNIASQNAVFAAAPFTSDYFRWFRVTNDSTNLTFSVSPDGLLWVPIYTELANTFLGTIDKVGFGIDRYQMPVNVESYAILWSWVET